MFKIRFKTIRFIFIAFTALIFQASLINVFGPVIPDLSLIMVVFFSLYNGSSCGIVCGCVMGLLLDVFSAGILGVNCFTLGSVGFFTGLLKERVYTNHILTMILVCGGSCMLSILIYYILAQRFYHLYPFWENAGLIFKVILVTTLANIIISSFLEKLVVEKQMSLE